MAFNYRFPVQPTDPNSKSSFTRGFAHQDWVDGQDPVQAQQTPDEDGFNTRFHRIEHDLDALAANLANAFACINILRGQVAQALTDIQNQFNAKPLKENKEGKDVKDTKDVKDGKDVKDTKDNKDNKDNKDTKDTKDTKDSKDTKDNKDVKDNKDSKDTKDKKDKDKEKEKEKIIGAAEKQKEIFTPLSAMAGFLWPEAPPVEAAAGRAFIRPDERPEVGGRVMEQASQAVLEKLEQARVDLERLRGDVAELGRVPDDEARG